MPQESACNYLRLFGRVCVCDFSISFGGSLGLFSNLSLSSFLSPILSLLKQGSYIALEPVSDLKDLVNKNAL